MTTEFSVITVTRNNLAGLKRTRESLKIQSCMDYEWIIIDGNSSDGTKEYLSTLPARALSEPDEGIYDAMNKGIKLATGKYLIFMNAGDIFAEAHVLQNVKDSASSADFIYGDSIEVFYKHRRHHKHIDFGLFTHHQSIFYRRECIGDLRYDVRYQIAADYDFTARFLKRASRVLPLPFPICYFESGGISQQKAWQGRREQFQSRRALGINPAKNILIFSLQTLTWSVRQVFPAFYARMKDAGPRGYNNQTAARPAPTHAHHP